MDRSTDSALVKAQSNTGLRFTNGFGPGSSPLHDQFSLSEYWIILLKRKWVIISTVAIVVTLAAVSTLRETPVYQAEGHIAINRESAEILGFKDIGSQSSEWEDYTVTLDTQLKVLQSSTLAWEVIRSLELEKHPEFAGIGKVSSQTPGMPEESDADRNAALIAAFKGRLAVALVPNTRVVAISFKSSDRQLAAKVVNTLANHFIDQNYKTKYESTMRASDWLSKQLSDLQLKVEKSQTALVEYQKQHSILGTDEHNNIITTKLDELNKELTAAEADRMQKEALVRTLQGNSPELAPTVQQSILIQRLREDEGNLQQQYAQALVTFGPEYPKVKELSSRIKQIQATIDAEVKRVGSRIKNEYDASVRRESMLRGALERQKTEANKLNESAIQYSLLKREVDSNRQLYEGLLQKMKEAGITAGLKSSNIRIIDPAEVPMGPISPNIPRTLGVALLGSLIMGIGLAFVLESMDKTMRSSEQVQLASGLPALGIVPVALGAASRRRKLYGHVPSSQQLNEAEKIETVTFLRPKSQMSEAYRALGTSILLSGNGEPPRLLMVTSALPEEGKTTTSINTAIVLSQQGGKVLLIDADLRRPSVHKAFDVESQIGLGAVLLGKAKIEDVTLPHPEIPNLFIVPAGSSVDNPAEMLGSEKMRDLLVTLRARYDYIVVDTPPVLTITDAVRLSPRADAVLLVIRSGQTTKEALCRARDLLHQVNANLLGVVVNAVNLDSPEYYSYYSKYGNRYYYEETVSKN